MSEEDLTWIATRADALEAWMHENSGTTADWPLDLVIRDSPEDAAHFSRLLQGLREALEPWRKEKL